MVLLISDVFPVGLGKRELPPGLSFLFVERQFKHAHSYSKVWMEEVYVSKLIISLENPKEVWLVDLPFFFWTF